MFISLPSPPSPPPSDSTLLTVWSPASHPPVFPGLGLSRSGTAALRTVAQRGPAFPEAPRRWLCKVSRSRILLGQEQNGSGGSEQDGEPRAASGRACLPRGAGPLCPARVWVLAWPAPREGSQGWSRPGAHPSAVHSVVRKLGHPKKRQQWQVAVFTWLCPSAGCRRPAQSSSPGTCVANVCRSRMPTETSGRLLQARTREVSEHVGLT